MNTYLKSTRIIESAIALLSRQIALPSLFWRQGVEDFRGAAGDTVTLRLPAYGVANTRELRSAGPIELSELHERGVNVTLDTDVYHAVPVTDEELTLDIVSFAGQVLAPQTEAVARGVEDLAVATLTGADYETSIEMDPSSPRAALLSARRSLNLANIPHTDRYVAMGADVEQALLGDSTLTRVDTSGTDSVLREAVIGRLYGFTLVSIPALPPGMAVAFHRTAFALASAAPVVPSGATDGATFSSEGLAMRHIRDYDVMNLRDRSVINSYVGTAAVVDNGNFQNGRFVPAQIPDGGPNSDRLVRAVEIALTEDSP